MCGNVDINFYYTLVVKVLKPKNPHHSESFSNQQLGDFLKFIQTATITCTG